MATQKKRTMSEEHKAALAAGRNQSRVVKSYLEALESNKPRRGRRRTPESITKRLAAIDDAWPTADPLKRLALSQERMDLTKELEAMNNTVDLSKLEAEFVKVAKDYSASKGYTYAAWREVGVPAEVLKRAGISRGM